MNTNENSMVKVAAAILLSPVIAFVFIKTLWKVRKDITFPKPEMWE